MKTFNDVPSLIRNARQNMSQRAFARAIGATQSMVSRYERGVSSPPSMVLNACMRLMHHSDATAEFISAEQLASKVIQNLAKPKDARLRVAIAQLIDGVTLGSTTAEQTIAKGNKS